LLAPPPTRTCSLFIGLTIGIAATLAGSAVAQQVPESEQGKLFYVLGATMGKNVQAQFHLEKNEVDWVLQGMRDALAGQDGGLDARSYQTGLQELARTRHAAAAEAEKGSASKFVEQAKKAKGAVTTDSGLVFTSILEGSGEKPAATDTVKVHYHGTLRDGTVFDSSVERGDPAEFPLNRVIPCWTEGLQLMRVGGKSTLVCPPDIAYGDRGAPPAIPGGAALKFEVELLEIKGK